PNSRSRLRRHAPARRRPLPHLPVRALRRADPRRLPLRHDPTFERGRSMLAARMLESRQLVLILDFGSQYTQLIARRVRECGVYCEIVPYSVELDAIRSRQPRALILSGGPASVYGAGAPQAPRALFELGVP